MKHLIKLFLPLLLIFSCADEQIIPETESLEEDFFIEINIENSTHRVSSLEYDLEIHGGTKGCAYAGYVYGEKEINLSDASEKGFIRSVNFSFSKKIFKDELSVHEDLSYLSNLVTSKTFGFPINQNGFYEVYDLENSQFEVSRNANVEAYMWLNTAEGIYRSTSVVPNERDPSSFLNITNVVVNSGPMADEYPYILEGTFKVNLFKGFYGTTSEQVVGKFRWPIPFLSTSELFEMCG